MATKPKQAPTREHWSTAPQCTQDRIAALLSRDDYQKRGVQLAVGAGWRVDPEDLEMRHSKMLESLSGHAKLTYASAHGHHARDERSAMALVKALAANGFNDTPRADPCVEAREQASLAERALKIETRFAELATARTEKERERLMAQATKDVDGAA